MFLVRVLFIQKIFLFSSTCVSVQMQVEKNKKNLPGHETPVFKDCFLKMCFPTTRRRIQMDSILNPTCPYLFYWPLSKVQVIQGNPLTFHMYIFPGDFSVLPIGPPCLLLSSTLLSTLIYNFLYNFAGIKCFGQSVRTSLI